MKSRKLQVGVERFKINLSNMKCVVPENIQTSTTEGIGNSRGEGGWTIKSLSRGKYHFVFDLSSNIASYQTGGSFLGHK